MLSAATKELSSLGSAIGTKSRQGSIISCISNYQKQAEIGGFATRRTMSLGSARIDSGRITRPLERSLVAVGRQVRRRCIRVALFGAVELADLSEVDLCETNLDLLVLLIVELAIAQLALHG
jgi:hypothetical protein